jgi:hypothetical protein
MVPWPLAARAQQLERMRRIGVLMAVAEKTSCTQKRPPACPAWGEGSARLNKSIRPISHPISHRTPQHGAGNDATG